MLRVYFEEFMEHKYDKIIDDVDVAFAVLNVTGSDVDKALLRDIEQAEYLSNGEVFDRFGFKIRMDDISSGCKAALLIANQSRPVDITECGLNAEDAILRHCRTGVAVSRYRNSFGSKVADHENVDIAFDGIRFRDLTRFDQYVSKGFDCPGFIDVSDLEKVEM